MLRSVNGCWSWRGLIREKNVLIYRGFILLLSVGIPSVFCLEHTPAVPFVRFHFGLQQCPALAAALGTPELFPNPALPRNSHRAGAAAGALDSPSRTSGSSLLQIQQEKITLLLLKNQFSSISLLCSAWCLLRTASGGACPPTVLGFRVVFCCSWNISLLVYWAPFAPSFTLLLFHFLCAQPSLSVCCSC